MDVDAKPAIAVVEGIGANAAAQPQPVAVVAPGPSSSGSGPVKAVTGPLTSPQGPAPSTPSPTDVLPAESSDTNIGLAPAPATAGTSGPKLPARRASRPSSADTRPSSTGMQEQAGSSSSNGATATAGPSHTANGTTSNSSTPSRTRPSSKAAPGSTPGAQPAGPSTTAAAATNPSSSKAPDAAGSRARVASTGTRTPSKGPAATDGAPGPGSSGGTPSRRQPAGGAGVGRGLGASLPARVQVTGGPIIDPDESPATQQLRTKVHAIRVALIRAARRLDYDHDNGIVKQVLYRLYLAEKLKEPFKGKSQRGVDFSTLATRTAAKDADRLEKEQGPQSLLGLNVKILFIGLAGSGKTQLIHTLLNSDINSSSSSSSAASSSSDPTAAWVASGGSSGGGGSSSSRSKQQLQQQEAVDQAVDPFSGATTRVKVTRGPVLGCEFTLIDTPGLHSSAAGFASNLQVLQQIRKAFVQHKPDLIIYVDRFDRPERNCHEMAVLQALTRMLGSQVWLNTIVVLTHAASYPEADAQGKLSYEKYASARTQWLQLVIRHASGDMRLMNPITSVESHPLCQRNEQGQLVLPNKLPWQQHLLLMIVSAKLLADAEAALNMTPNAQGAGGDAAGNSLMRNDPAIRALMMGRSAAPPVRYLMTQLTQSSHPLTFPDHSAVMEVRRAQAGLKKQRGSRRKKELSRQIKMRLLQMKQMYKRAQRMTDLQVKASKAGAKMVPQVPRTANRSRPGVQPPPSHRYRVPEAGNGWIIRPNIEPHGWEGTDGVEGFVVEKTGVARRCSTDILKGCPYRASVTATAGKEQALVSGRGEISGYLNLAGTATTTLTADVQTSPAAAGPPDLLMVLKAEVQKAGFPVAANAPALALLACRLAQECQLHRGPLALGVRLQDSLRLAPRGVPMEMDMAVGQMVCRPDGENEDALGANLELRTDGRHLLRSRYSAPLSLSASYMQHKGEALAALSSGCQLQLGRGKLMGVKLQVNNRGLASAGVQVRAHRDTWWGLVALVPLFNLARERLAQLRGGQRGNHWQQQQQQQQQPLPDLEGLADMM